MTQRPIYKVSIPNTNRDSFDYLAQDVSPCIGARVWVSFRKKMRVGIVIAIGEPENESLELKTIESIIDDAALVPAELLTLCQWMSGYYQSPLSEVLPLILPKKYREGKPCHLSQADGFTLNCSQQEAYQRISPQAHRQRALVDFFTRQKTVISKKMLVQAGFASAQLRPLLKQEIVKIQPLLNQPNSGTLFPALSLNAEQETAVNTINGCLDVYRCFLLQGVTGSGKTEVYLQVIAGVLARNRQALILVPEIGLTPQLLARFTARFNESMVVLHSHLNATERQQAWQLAAENKAKLVIGTRSAVFTPMPSLGLIVIDEEHDASLKQMDGVRYSARDTALMRAYNGNMPIILGSATPSLESLYNCTINKYALLALNQKALNSTPLHYHILDIRNQQLQHGLASTTVSMIDRHLQQQNQVLVFINRRGFAPVLLCHQCGWMADCRACDSHLTLHRSIRRLICHHCGLTTPVMTQCHTCRGNDLQPIGAGTQRIYDFLATQFPQTVLLRVDRDEVQKKHALNEHLERINTGEAQLIVGTQMLAKGHHFPRLTLVVILDTDNGFYNQDFRALERLGQLITQVAGRAGRAEFPGQVVIQTHLPQHPLLNVLIQQGYAPFAQALLEVRQQAALPPYHFLAVIRAQCKNLPKLLDFMHAVKAQLQTPTSKLQVLGPAPAPLARKAGQHRMQLLIKSSSRKKLQAALTPLRDWLTMSKSSGVRWNIDIDPMDLS
jgi:primosomal protein N' (replication factor Y)